MRDLAHTVWSGLLSLLGVLILWNWKQLNKRVDDKADRKELDQLRTDMNSYLTQSQRQHTDNTRRLDEILLALTQGGSHR